MTDLSKPDSLSDQAATDVLPAPCVPLVRCRLTFRALEPVVLPPFAGSTWRGLLGAALRRLARPSARWPQGTAGAEAARRELFEAAPAPDAAKMRRYRTVPPPFLLAPPFRAEPMALAEGERTALDLTLVGRAGDHLPPLIEAFALAAELGVGRERGRLLLAEVAELDHDRLGALIYGAGGRIALPPPRGYAAPPPPAGPVAVTFATPLRLKCDERLVGPDELTAGALLMSLLRRVSMLSYFHTEAPHETDFERLKQLAAGARVTARALAWHEQARWSATHQDRLAMGGIIGRAALELAPALWPYLWLGQWLHAGKGTTMGNGALRLAAG